MKKIILTLSILVLFVSQVFAAEFLVRAKGHWMDNLSQEEVDAMSNEKKEQYDARTQKGDIIVVKPDGWEWGSGERLPDFVVVKIPSMTYEDAKEYEGGYYNNNTPQKLLKHRKHRINHNTIDVYVEQEKDTVVIENSGTVASYVNAIIDKSE